MRQMSQHELVGHTSRHQPRSRQAGAVPVRLSAVQMLRILVSRWHGTASMLTMQRGFDTTTQ